MRRMLRGTALALVAVAVVGLAACTAAPEQQERAAARPLTTAEAQVLATMRFRNVDAGARSVSFAVADADEAPTAFEGWFDYASGVGYGSLGPDGAAELLLWNDDLVAAHPPAPGGGAPLPPPDTDPETTVPSWTGEPLSPSSSRRDAVLAVIGSLGSDRPENPLLLQQTGALWLGSETVDGVPLTIFAGPASDEALPPEATPDPEAATTRYWVDAAGLAHRVEIRLGGESEWTRIVFGDAGATRLEDPFVPGGS